jgi:anti-sigma factor RsiW
MTQHARSGDEFSKATFSKKAFTDAEKFELLSAYLDDEVTEQEQCLVEHWLSSDLALQQHYQAQLRLRSAMRAVFNEPGAPTSHLFSSEPPAPADPLIMSSPTDSPTDNSGSSVGLSLNTSLSSTSLSTLGSPRALGL